MKFANKTAYISDAIFPEEKEALETEQAIFKGLRGQTTGTEFSAFDCEDSAGDNSKSHVDMSLKLEYQGTEEDKPI